MVQNPAIGPEMASSGAFDLSALQLYADKTERLLICCHTDCGFALSVSRSQATSHLRDKHNISKELRDGLTRYLKHGHPYPFRNPADVAPRDDGSQVHRMLRIHDGFACRACPYRTINYAEYSRHASKEHLNGRNASRKRVDPYYDEVYLQTWTHGSSRKYWTVKKNGSIIRPVGGWSVGEHMQQLQQREIQRTEEQERTHSTNMTTPTLAGTRPWMDRTRWEIIYQGLRRDILRSLTEMPCSSPRIDHVLGQRSNTADLELVSPQVDEARIALLMVAVDHMVDRWEDTMRHTGRTILCWLKSTKPQTCYPKPFTLVALPSSEKKYRQLLKRFLAFVFRAFRMSVDVRHRLTGIRFKREQLRQIRAIWEHGAWSDANLSQGRWPGSRDGEENVGGDIEDEGEGEDEYETDEGEDNDNEDAEGDVEEGERDDSENNKSEDDERGVGYGSEDEYQQGELCNNASAATDELRELVFQLCVTFSTEEFVDSQPSSSLLVYFSGILGFSPDARSFLSAKAYTPHLSALIYIQRLLFLEYALPLRPYPHLGISRRSRFQQHQNFDIIRQRYMITGSPTPLEEFQSLRDFGRVIARTDPPSFLLRWSDDGETVFYGDDFSLNMESFRQLAEHFLAKAETLCDELMFGLDPVIDLQKVKDDLTNTNNGFSFVQHPANKLTDAYLDLSRKACTTRRNGLFRGNQWDWKAISLYRKEAEALQEMVAGVKQTGGGQVARISELSSLEYENSSSTERGIYVYNGYMIFVTRHHKAKRSTNREFNVVRFLCVRGGHVVYKYLVYIRPFLEMLRREQSSYFGLAEPMSQRHFLFRSEQAPDKPWDSSRYTSILKKATIEVWNFPANSQLYRQLTIGITERHVEEVHKPFNRFDDKTVMADMNVVFAWQSGHRPIQRATTYGLDGAFPTKLQPALLRVYEWASTRWHEFLHQPSKVMPSIEATVMCGGARGLSPPVCQSGRIIDAQSSKRRSPPWLQDDVHSTRSTKRRTLPWCGSPQNVENVRLAQSQVQFSGIEGLAIPTAKQSAHPTDITRVEACRDSGGGKPASDDESDSLFDWDEADMIPSISPNVSVAQPHLQLLVTQGRVPITAKRPARPADIIARVEAWKDGTVGKPVSDDEGDSLIDWDEADMIPSNDPTDGPLPSWSRASWPSWSRHNRRIESKIDKSRQFHGVFDVKELRPHEQTAMRGLTRCLDTWSRCCIVCDFKGNPIGPRDQHATHGCRDSLYRTVQNWTPLFLARLQRLAYADTQSCPVCLVPRLVCDRWKQGKSNKWAESGSECQYNGVVVLTVLTALEGAVEIREELDIWMDSWLHSRNLDRVCQWLSERTVGDNLCGLRIIKVFQLVSSAWGRLSSTNQGYYSPRLSWITSTGPASKADDAADEAAYTSREQKRQSEKARSLREGRDWSGLDVRLDSWMEKCPICYVRKMAGHDIDTAHNLERCMDEKREIVSSEIAKLQEIKFAAGVSCQLCAVPQETCHDSMYFTRHGKERCLYSGIVREAVAGIMVVGPDVVIEKMYAWMRSEGVWSENEVLSKGELQQVTQMMLEWFSRRASWRDFTASVLVQVFNQLDRWVEAFGKGMDLEEYVGTK